MNDDSEMVLPLVEEVARCNAVLALHTRVPILTG